MMVTISRNHRVHIKLADQGWILEKCAREISLRAKNVTYSTKEDPNAAIQYYINYSARQKRVSPIEIAFFTHSERDTGARNRFFDCAGEVDVCVCMADRYGEELLSNNIKNVRVIPPGVDLAAFQPRVRIGVVGRTYHTGRKGEHLVAEVMNIPGIDWRFTGSGWPAASTTIPSGKLPDFYRDLDYVLVPSLYEGGPMPAIEALACGVPVISSDVGWMNRLPHIPFENGNVASLRDVLESLVQAKLKERNSLRKATTSMTWENWAEEHIVMFDELLSTQGSLSSRKTTDAQSQRGITIISDKAESKSKGGPTSRIHNIQVEANRIGIDIDVKNSVDQSAIEAGHVIHVFNSWPLKSAIKNLRSALNAGATTVYSPIALNLQYHPHYSNAVPYLLENCRDAEQLSEGIRAVRRCTMPFVPSARTPPAEGIPNHHQALRAGVAMADHVIFLSEYEEAFVKSIGAAPDSSSIVRNGVDTSVMIQGNAADFQNLYGITDFILIVGRIESRKNQAVIVHALRHLKVPVVCIGHIGEPTYFAHIKKWAGPNFIHIDRIDDRAVLAGAYKSARCVVIASWAEGAPLVALEAAAAGSPLVLSTMSGEEEYFGADALYTHPADLVGIREAVEQAFELGANASLRDKLAVKYADLYSIDRHTADTLAAYKAVSSRTRAEPPFASRGSHLVSIDNTHIAHHLDRTSVLTGVTNVEYHLSKALREAQPQILSRVWRGPDDGHYTTTFDEIVARKGTPANISRITDAFAPTVRINHVHVHVPLKQIPLTRKRKIISAFKHALSALPSPIQRATIGGIKLARPNFDPSIRPEHNLLQRLPAANVTVTPSYKAIPTQNDGFAQNERVLLLGQPWISNEVMLNALCQAVQDYGLQLWAHIPDIVYVVDSESFDDATRRDYRRRLEKLLDHTQVAIVISDRAEREISQFIAARSLATTTKRIRLSIGEGLVDRDTQKPTSPLPSRFVMYVGSMNNRKRHNFMTDVWRDVRRHLGPAYNDVAMLYVGSPQKGHEKYNDRSYRNALLADGIHILCGTTEQELAWLYANCLFTVYPSRTEGWGIPPMESLYFGKPCIVSETIPSAEETRCSALVKLPAEDYFAWVDTLSALIAKPELVEGLSRSAAGFTIPSWEDAASQLLS